MYPIVLLSIAIFLLSCFITGLKPHIKREVQALLPLNLMQAIDLAKLQEERYLELRNFNRSSFNYPSNTSVFPNSRIPSSSNPPLLPKPPSNVPVKRLFASEI